MNVEKLNQWLALVANIGVISGIVFLALEMEQNTRALQAQTRDSVAEKQLDYFMGIGADEYASRIFFGGLSGEFEPGDLEWRSFNFIVAGNVRMWENEWYQYNQGLFGEEEFEGRTRTWSNLMNNPNWHRAWDSAKGGLSQSFQIFMDSLME